MWNHHKYTLFGVAAILLWASSIGLMRTVTELLSPLGGAAMIYTVSTLCLLFVVGLPKFTVASCRYLFLAGVAFAAYEVCLSMAIGMANDRYQVMDMTVINYLWPALTVLLTVVTSHKPVKFWLLPGVLVAFTGVVWCITNGQSLSYALIRHHVATNPFTYCLAFSGAIIWAVYCTVTQKISDGENGITLFCALTAAVLWIQYGLSDEASLHLSVNALIYLMITGAVMGGGYGLWNLAILRGNMMLLATLSYFTPVFAALFSSIILGIVLGLAFWQGVMMVSIGSLVCWWATREPVESRSRLELIEK
ncbi:MULTISPECIES: aromatic amino acid DMT transporter YddG [Vibrio]|uniref:Aromatic amino acid DMT transporter YddG n=2 Tax=Vibrio TaxID=662 RepID=A0A7X4LJ99_9VIBR|nr:MULTISPECIES: aromatic amino acid DMT transporter YddG [Vibrio]MBF9002837.1 aromatic amino acid DMT transporter YddG [Vibrio nitrifigilis]MZI92942.1 aromatic amino acid DMT transporter YddG [Vibrio eleionomae]